MAELVYLVVAYCLISPVGADTLEIILAGSNAWYAGARESYFWSGEKLIYCRCAATFLLKAYNVRKRLIIPAELMDKICVIPHDDKILSRRFQCGKTLYNSVRIDYACWVWIFRNAPYTLNSRVFYGFLNCIHIRALICHRYCYKLCSEVSWHGKMPVIARGGTKEFESVKLSPWRAATKTVYICNCQNPVHKGQAGISANEHLAGFYTQNICHKLAAWADTL